LNDRNLKWAFSPKKEKKCRMKENILVQAKSQDLTHITYADLY